MGLFRRLARLLGSLRVNLERDTRPAVIDESRGRQGDGSIWQLCSRRCNPRSSRVPHRSPTRRCRSGRTCGCRAAKVGSGSCGSLVEAVLTSEDRPVELMRYRISRLLHNLANGKNLGSCPQRPNEARARRQPRTDTNRCPRLPLAPPAPLSLASRSQGEGGADQARLATTSCTCQEDASLTAPPPRALWSHPLPPPRPSRCRRL